MIEQSDAHFLETSAKMNDEPAEKSIEEIFQILGQREVVSPAFPLETFCVEVLLPRRISPRTNHEGLPKHAVRFLSKISFSIFSRSCVLVY